MIDNWQVKTTACVILGKFEQYSLQSLLLASDIIRRNNDQINIFCIYSFIEPNIEGVVI